METQEPAQPSFVLVVTAPEVYTGDPATQEQAHTLAYAATVRSLDQLQGKSIGDARFLSARALQFLLEFSHAHLVAEAQEAMEQWQTVAQSGVRHLHVVGRPPLDDGDGPDAA